MFRANYKNFTISAKFDGLKVAPWDDCNDGHNVIFVKNNNNGKKTSFDFWGSRVNPVVKTEYEILNAFYCFVSDAVSGLDSFYDFCRNFGYDEDSRSAEKTWKACKKLLEKFKRVSEFSTDEIYNFLNELCEVVG